MRVFSVIICSFYSELLGYAFSVDNVLKGNGWLSKGKKMMFGSPHFASCYWFGRGEARISPNSWEVCFADSSSEPLVHLMQGATPQWIDCQGLFFGAWCLCWPDNTFNFLVAHSHHLVAIKLHWFTKNKNQQMKLFNVLDFISVLEVLSLSQLNMPSNLSCTDNLCWFFLKNKTVRARIGSKFCLNSVAP